MNELASVKDVSLAQATCVRKDKQEHIQVFECAFFCEHCRFYSLQAARDAFYPSKVSCSRKCYSPMRNSGFF